MTYGYFIDTAAIPNALTIQRPANATKNVKFKVARIFASSDAVVTIERDGTPGSATVVTPFKTNSLQPSPQCQVFESSNAGVGTVIDKVYVTTNSRIEYDLTYHDLNSAGNLTFRITSGGSPVVRISVLWDEQAI